MREEGEVVEELARADEELEVGREEEGTGEEEGEAEGLERGQEEEKGGAGGGGRGMADPLLRGRWSLGSMDGLVEAVKAMEK